jgi:hypothetical protein
MNSDFFGDEAATILSTNLPFQSIAFVDVRSAEFHY